MSSAAEQLASGVNLRAFFKAEDLKKRLWFTLGALIVFRLGTYVPLPGIDPTVIQEIARQNSGGILGMFDMFSGGALSRMTIFALNIMPYITASIIMQLLTTIVPYLEGLKKEGDLGRKKINQYTRYATVALGSTQAFAIAIGLPMMSGGGHSAVLNPGAFFTLTTIVTLIGGTMFLLWLGEQITSRGIGNGISLIIFSGIVANLPFALVSTLELGRSGARSFLFIIGIALMVVAVIAFIVFMERAYRKVPVQYPKRQISGGRMVGGDVTHMPLKLNVSGVIPPIFASSLLLMPVTISSFISSGKRTLDPSGTLWASVKNFFAELPDYLAHGKPLYITFFTALIVFFCFFYTAIVFNPDETAENLRKNGGFVPGVRPGKSTAQYFDYVLTRITVLGAAYISFVCILPELLISQMSVPFYFGGTSLLIVVSVTLDTVAQVHSHLIAHQYEGLLKKSRHKGLVR